jgi:hypothetical protein
VGLLSLFFTGRNQRLGDLAANTVVVYERGVERPVAPPVNVVARYGAPRLAPEEVALVDRFLQRRSAMDSYVRLKTAREILARIRHRLDMAADARVDEERVLEEIATEYRAHR